MRILILCLLLPFCLNGKNPPNEIYFFSGDLKEIQNRAATEGKLYILYFMAEWCMPCQYMEEYTFTDRQLSSYVNTYYLPYKVNIDDIDGFSYKQQYEIKVLPSFLIFNSKGELLDRFEESLSPSKMLLILQNFNKPKNRRVVKASPPNFEATSGGEEALVAYPEPEMPVIGTYNAQSEPISNEPEESSFEYDEFKEPEPTNYTNKNQQETTLQPSNTSAAPPPVKQTYRPPSQSYSASERTNSTYTSTSRTNAEPPRSGYTIQIGAYSNYSSVQQESKKFKRRFNKEVYIFPIKSKGRTIYKMVIGAFPNKSEANTFLYELKRASIDGFVKNLADF